MHVGFMSSFRTLCVEHSDSERDGWAGYCALRQTCSQETAAVLSGIPE